MSKKVKIYFYYMTPKRIKAPENAGNFKKKDFSDFFHLAMDYVIESSLIDRRYKYELDKAIAWISYYKKLNKDNSLNSDLTIKSAKYNRIRNVRNTETMKENTKARKAKQDGDEEKTHICIRDNDTKEDYLCIIESNAYGLSKSKLAVYINWVLDIYAEKTGSPYNYEVEFEYVPCDSFVEEIEKMRTISLLKITTNKKTVGDDFKLLADLEETKNTVELVYKRKKRNLSLPKEPIKAYYDDLSGDNSRIYRIIAEGTGDNGPIKLDSDLIKMKRELSIETTIETEEIDDKSFFNSVQLLLTNMKR